ncbi:MAG: glycosyltransferase family 39 protein [Solirubrobacteraceae bacterium]
MTRARLLYGTGILALIVLSLFLRTREMGTHFWIDEGLSIGIARHGLFDIPGVLIQDGSPPLYYMVLHLWIGLVGESEAATHWLSLIFALACIPVALWAGTSLFGPRVGWILAGLTAFNPFLTSYAQETRMYSLVILLGLLATAFYLHAYVYDRRRYRIPFGVALALLLYTHNWGLFLGLAFAAGVAIRWFAFTTEPPQRRQLLKDAAIGFGTAAILYLPWVPSLISQALHTGAPWANPPGFTTLVHAPDRLLGGFGGTVIVILAAGAGLAAVARLGRRERRVLVPVLVLLAVTPIVVAWVGSQVSPAWATRYLAVAVAPLLVLAALGLAKAGRLGIVGLAILAIMWLLASAPSSKSNAHYVAYGLGGKLNRGDLVISTQPEQVPVLSLYVDRWRKRLGRPGAVTYATPFGIQKDTGVTDWRDGAEHFDRTGVDTQLMPLLDKLPVGGQVMLVVPIISKPERWTAPWTSRVAARSIEYEGVLRGDPRFELTATVPEYLIGSPGPNPLQGLLFRKYRNG